MPSADTFSVPPIGAFVRRHLEGIARSVDPFARNSRLATHRNDLDPSTLAESHEDAVDWLHGLAARGERFDAAIFDPPYSPRQIAEVYAGVGRKCGMVETQSAVMYQRARDALVEVLSPNAVVLSFGWNSVGMGQKHGFRIEEILLVCHGGAHNDTICLAERRDGQHAMDWSAP